MIKEDFIRKFILSYEIEKGRYSCLIIALSDARRLTGRNIDSGLYEQNILNAENTFHNPYSFIGLINYLLILDMIGEIVKLKNFPTTKKANIFKSLSQFSRIEKKDIDTVIALRNSLAHNYGLINIPHDEKEYPTKRHKFTIDNRVEAPLIAYPIKSWSGDFTDKSDDTSTSIGYFKMCELVESVYKNVEENSKADLIELVLGKDIDELKSRFTIRY